MPTIQAGATTHQYAHWILAHVGGDLRHSFVGHHLSRWRTNRHHTQARYDSAFLSNQTNEARDARMVLFDANAINSHFLTCIAIGRLDI